MIDYNTLLNANIKSIKPSGIRKFFDLMTEMKDAISLGIGEPDFVTPWHIREAGIKSLNDGNTYYTANAGLIELRREISDYLSRRFSQNYDPKSEILVTVGGSEAIDLAIRVLVEKGDEVIIPQPSFVCYEPITIMAGGTPVIIPLKAENNFKLTAKELKEKITDKTKMLVLPFPNNPTGAIIEKHELEEIAEALRGTDIIVLSDEIYAELTYKGKHTSITQFDGMRKRTVVVNGLSKSHAMTGWRMGYACAPAPIMSAMTKLHQFGIMSAPTTSQFASVYALKNGDADIERMKDSYNMRRAVITEGFCKMGLDCYEPLGAFYVFPSIKKTGMSSTEFCEKLLLEEKVAVIPGNSFGDSGEGFVRCSYAYSIETINEALVRIERFVKKHI